MSFWLVTLYLQPYLIVLSQIIYIYALFLYYEGRGGIGVVWISEAKGGDIAFGLVNFCRYGEQSRSCYAQYKFGYWRLVIGYWRLAIGYWRLAIGGWS